MGLMGVGVRGCMSGIRGCVLVSLRVGMWRIRLGQCQISRMSVYVLMAECGTLEPTAASKTARQFVTSTNPSQQSATPANAPTNSTTTNSDRNAF